MDHVIGVESNGREEEGKGIAMLARHGVRDPGDSAANVEARGSSRIEAL